ncbi:hypothetical protein COOONC_16439 [Cooperia oncophora]
MEGEIKPGFDRENFDQTKRTEAQQENINRTVLSKIVRIVAVPNKEKRSAKEVAEFFIKEVCKENPTVYGTMRLEELIGYESVRGRSHEEPSTGRKRLAEPMENLSQKLPKHGNILDFVTDVHQE